MVQLADGTVAWLSLRPAISVQICNLERGMEVSMDIDDAAYISGSQPDYIRYELSVTLIFYHC